jgi:hypothetical protein
VKGLVIILIIIIVNIEDLPMIDLEIQSLKCLCVYLRYFVRQWWQHLRESYRKRSSKETRADSFAA